MEIRKLQLRITSSPLSKDAYKKIGKAIASRGSADTAIDDEHETGRYSIKVYGTVIAAKSDALLNRIVTLLYEEAKTDFEVVYAVEQSGGWVVTSHKNVSDVSFEV